VGALLFAAAVPYHGTAQSPAEQTNVGLTTVKVMENERVIVFRQTFAVGARQAYHPPNFDIVVTQLNPADAEWRIGEERTSGRQEPGKVWYIKKGTMHSAANLGKQPFDLMIVVLK